MKHPFRTTTDVSRDASTSGSDMHTLALVAVIACLLFAILLVRSQDAGILPVEQINQMLPWGP
jgi:hypothetical protein